MMMNEKEVPSSLASFLSGEKKRAMGHGSVFVFYFWVKTSGLIKIRFMFVLTG